MMLHFLIRTKLVIMLGSKKKRKSHTTSTLQKIMFVILSIKLHMMLNYKVETSPWIACTQVACNWLLGRKITCVGTLKHNRQGIPTELKNTSEREELSVTCHYESVKKGLCLLSYIVKTKSSSKKNVLLLSTMRPLNKQKLGIYKFYDFTKGGTDIMDQLNDYHTVRSQINRWDLKVSAVTSVEKHYLQLETDP